jgi:methyl-accepting chemotaxis protein
MALVKTSEIAAKPGASAAANGGRANRGQANAGQANAGQAPSRLAMAERRARDRSRLRQEKAAERIGAATEELASGLAEAAAAAEELRRSLERIASAAEQAAGASQESQAAVLGLGEVFAQARDHAAGARQKTQDLQSLLLDTGAQIESLARSARGNAERQMVTVKIVSALETQATDIGEITRAVGDIADQTNLLALNAAIEAARAGEHGRGFAVVADEVRAFADISEKSARAVRDLAEAIAESVREIARRINIAADAARDHSRAGLEIVATLSTIRADMARMADGSGAILAAVVEAETGAREARRGAEMVASAAEEQSSATIEAQQAVLQQSASLEESQRTSETLARLAEDLRDGGVGPGGTVGTGGNSEQVASGAEQLSAAVQELSGAAGQILTAIEQISRGAHEQAAATQEATAAMAQIEKAALSIRHAAEGAVRDTDALAPVLDANRDVVSSLIAGMVEGAREISDIIGLAGGLEIASRRIEKIIDSIALVAVQTNMLAVSGSIEAARAGEFGRGFAVVSSDIRDLARDSAANADRVKDTARLIQDQMIAVRQGLERIAETIEVEIEGNRSVTEKLASVSTEMVGARAGAADILAGSGSVLAAVREVLGGTRQIAAAAEETSAAASQASQAAREQAQGVEDLAAAIEEIASLADELRMAES